jgi:hypothetical protein
VQFLFLHYGAQVARLSPRGSLNEGLRGSRAVVGSRPRVGAACVRSRSRVCVFLACCKHASWRWRGRRGIFEACNHLVRTTGSVARNGRGSSKEAARESVWRNNQSGAGGSERKAIWLRPEVGLVLPRKTKPRCPMSLATSASLSLSLSAISCSSVSISCTLISEG